MAKYALTSSKLNDIHLAGDHVRCKGVPCTVDIPEYKTVFLAECLQPLIRCLNTHQSAVILGKQEVRAYPLAVHVDDVLLLLGFERSHKLHYFLRNFHLAHRTLCLRLTDVHTLSLVISGTLDDIDYPCLKVNIFPFKPEYLTLAHTLTYPRVEKTEKAIYSEKEIQALLDAIEKYPPETKYKLFIYIVIIISSYGNMKALDHHLVDYATFQNLIKYRYVYGEFDDVYYTVGEYDRRREEWEKISLTERERWWAYWLEDHEMIN